MLNRNNILVLILLFLHNTFSYAEPKYICSEINVGAGLAYDQTDKLNAVLSGINYNQIAGSSAPFASIKFGSNFMPLLFDRPTDLAYSINLQLPLPRSGSDKSSLKTYSASFDIYLYESLKKSLTVFPVLGIGLSKTFINSLPLQDGQSVAQLSAEKTTLQLNIGGGFIWRIKLNDDSLVCHNLAITLLPRYCISLDFLGLYNSNWETLGKQNILPHYNPPGLSLSLSIGYENQKRRYK